MKDYKSLKNKILEKYPHASESELDELLNNGDLMTFVDELCFKNDSEITDYIPFVIKSIDAAFDPGYPSNLNNLQDVVIQAMSVRAQYKEKPTLVQFLSKIRDYAMNKAVEGQQSEMKKVKGTDS